MGDEVLKQVASRIKDNIRKNELVVRLGGDKFLIILITSRTEYRIEVKIGCSIGASVWPVDTKNMSEAIDFANQALYESKLLGKNQLTFFSD